MSASDRIHAALALIPQPDPVPIMLGPQGARRMVTEFLKTELPPLYNRMASAWGILDDKDWQSPRKYYDYEVSRLDPAEFPVVVVTVPNTGRIFPDSMDFVTGEPVYRCEYPVRIFNWVRTSSVDSCVRLRDYQSTAIRIALTSKGLRVGNISLSDRAYLATVMHETLTEEFAEVVGSGNGTYISGSYVSFTLVATERASSVVLSDLITAPNGGWDVVIEEHGTIGERAMPFV